VGTNFRLANAYELYADESYAIGNPDLKPEESINVELGLGASFDLFTAEINYYHSEIQDMIAVGGDQVFTNTDGGVEMETYEIQLNTTSFGGLSFGASAAFTEAENKDDKVQLTHIPESFYKGLMRYRNPSRRFGGDLNVRYIGKVYGTDYPGFGALNYGDYWNTDLSCFMRFGKELAHMITLRADNLFNEDYTSYGYGRTTGSDSEAFLYEYRGTPLAVMLSYKYTF
jgi:vitamin B12 transporter